MRLARNQSRWLVLTTISLVLGGIIGFALGWSRVPSAVLVPGNPTTLHLYLFDPQSTSPETVIFDRQSISRMATEVNRLPPFPKFGRDCTAKLSTYELTFDYKNGDQLTVDIRPSPCGMVTVRGEETAVADAFGSPLLDDVTRLLIAR